MIPNVIDKTIPEKALPDPIESKDVIDSIYETNILSMNINKTMTEEGQVTTEVPHEVDMEEAEIIMTTTEPPSIDIFNSTDLVLSKFTIENHEEEVVTEETLITSPSETVRPNVITQKEKFSPTAIPVNEEKKQSRRRKFFRKQMRHKTTPQPGTEAITESVKPSSRPMFRKLIKSSKRPEIK